MQMICKMIFLCCLLLFTNASFALPFNITVKSGTTLPTQMVRRTPVFAYYTIQNQTATTRRDNYIKYLPPHVTQITTDVIYPDPCDINFSLAPKGKPGDSCTLELRINGPVSARDPNQAHHLFACFPGGTTCAGTPYPLNVKLIDVPPPNVRLISINVTPKNHNLVIGATQQYTARGLYSDNSIQDITRQVTWASSMPFVATITSNGLATARDFGTTIISASLSGITGSTPLNVKFQMAYLSADGVPNGDVQICSVLPFGFLGCNPSGQPLLSSPRGIAINKEGTRAYIANRDNDTVIVCDILPVVGLFSNCRIATTTVDTPVGVAFNPSGSRLYVVNSSTNTANYKISICDVDTSSGVLNCHFQPITELNTPQAIAFNHLGTRAYITSYGNTSGNNVTVCSVINSTGELHDCGSANANIPSADGIVISRLQAYVADITTDKVYLCTITSNGDLNNCTATGGSSFDSPVGLALTSSGSNLYVVNNCCGKVSYCILNATGNVSSCITAANGFTAPTYFALALIN